MKSKWFAMLVIAAMGLMLLSACSKKETAANEAAQPAAAPAQTTAIDQSTVGSVNGVVKYTGTAPKPAKIDMSQDPACKGSNQVETLAVNDGNLENTFVYVKSGFNGTLPAPTEAVTIDQQGCRYHPHVLGVMVGQPVKIVNSDETTHNIHPTPKDNREWNESQPPKAAPIEKSFTREEIMLPVKCNQHPWMKMYINVVKTPFFAVTDKDGKYEIKGLPPGTYTLGFVQEKLGEQDQQVTIGPKESKAVDVSFSAAGASKPAGQ